MKIDETLLFFSFQIFSLPELDTLLTPDMIETLMPPGELLHALWI